MKKLVLLILTCVLLTGCSVVRIDTTSIGNITNVILAKNNTLYNQVGKGYKYYIPRGVTYIDTVGLNDILYSNGNYYYLYMDAVGFYYNIDNNYTENKDVYYSKLMDLNKKKGYLEIIKRNNKYLIKFIYNYAEITALVDEKDINEVVLNSSYILSTVKFNNNVIKLMLDDDYFVNREEKYDVFSSKTTTDNFLKAPDDGGQSENIDQNEE